MANWLRLQTTGEHERQYLQRINRGFLLLLISHFPLIPILSYVFDVSLFEGLFAFALSLSAPIFAVRTNPSARSTSCLLSFAAICVSGVLIHLSKGMIEFHFHIFVVLAWITVFGNPWAVATAAGAAAVHHLGFFLLLPSSVFNYDAGLGIVVLHAAFVVAESAVSIVIALRIHRMLAGQDAFAGNSTAVGQSVKDISDRFSECAAAFQDQSHSLQAAASAAAEINAMVASTAENAQRASAVGDELGRSAARGEALIHGLEAQFAKLTESASANENELRKGFADLQDLLGFFKEIEGKANVINDIVFQTKLLSFNASVEAARAGEHGRGFSVVAEEVGKLAQMSGHAAKEINSLLSSGMERSQSIIQRAIRQAEQSSSAVLSEASASRKQAEACLEVFAEMTSGLRTATERIDEIARANDEQKVAVESLTRTFANVVTAAREITEQANAQNTEGRAEAERRLLELRSSLDFALRGEDQGGAVIQAGAQLRQSARAA